MKEELMDYPVKKLAKMAGVSVRTLHHYDRIGLLKPQHRSTAGYRFYGEKELLQLQQILFYRELGFSLDEINRIIHHPGFDFISALKNHRKALLQKKKNLDVMLKTVELTLKHLKENTMKNYEDLYHGLPKEKAEAYRKEAIEKYGKETIEQSEQRMLKLGKEGFLKLKTDFEELSKQLANLKDNNPESKEVQTQIVRHFKLIELSWGKTPDKESYKGFGDLLANDERYTSINGIPNPGFGKFMQLAIHVYADENL